jgi:hypothetical protein
LLLFAHSLKRQLLFTAAAEARILLYLASISSSVTFPPAQRHQVMARSALVQLSQPDASSFDTLP